LGRHPNVETDIPAILVEFVSKRKRYRVRDYEEKRREYQAIGVREYWVVDWFGRTMTVFKNIPIEVAAAAKAATPAPQKIASSRPPRRRSSPSVLAPPKSPSPVPPPPPTPVIHTLPSDEEVEIPADIQRRILDTYGRLEQIDHYGLLAAARRFRSHAAADTNLERCTPMAPRAQGVEIAENHYGIVFARETCTAIDAFLSAQMAAMS